MSAMDMLELRWSVLDAIPESAYPDRMLHHSETRSLLYAWQRGEIGDEIETGDSLFDPFGIHGAMS